MVDLLQAPFAPEALSAAEDAFAILTASTPPGAVDTPLRWALSSTTLADIQCTNAHLTPAGHLLVATIITTDGLTLPFVPLAAIPHSRLYSHLISRSTAPIRDLYAQCPAGVALPSQDDLIQLTLHLLGVTALSEALSLTDSHPCATLQSAIRRFLPVNMHGSLAALPLRALLRALLPQVHTIPAPQPAVFPQLPTGVDATTFQDQLLLALARACRPFPLPGMTTCLPPRSPSDITAIIADSTACPGDLDALLVQLDALQTCQVPALIIAASYAGKTHIPICTDVDAEDTSSSMLDDLFDLNSTLAPALPGSPLAAFLMQHLRGVLPPAQLAGADADRLPQFVYHALHEGLTTGRLAPATVSAFIQLVKGFRPGTAVLDGDAPPHLPRPGTPHFPKVALGSRGPRGSAPKPRGHPPPLLPAPTTRARSRPPKRSRGTASRAPLQDEPLPGQPSPFFPAVRRPRLPPPPPVDDTTPAPHNDPPGTTPSLGSAHPDRTPLVRLLALISSAPTESISRWARELHLHILTSHTSHPSLPLLPREDPLQQWDFLSQAWATAPELHASINQFLASRPSPTAETVQQHITENASGRLSHAFPPSGDTRPTRTLPSPSSFIQHSP